LTWKSIEAASFQMTGLGCYRSYILMLIEVRSTNSYYNLNMVSITVCMPPPSLFRLIHREKTWALTNQESVSEDRTTSLSISTKAIV